MARRGSIKRPSYYRPTISEVQDQKQVQEYIDKGIAVKLDDNLWSTGTTKAWMRGGYNTELYLKRGKRFFRTAVPTDGTGKIPIDVMAERIMDIADGDRNGQQRNLFIDLSITAKNIHKPEEKAKLYIWYLYPNEGDIKGLDDANSKLVTILPSTSGKRRKSLLIIGGTKEQRDSVTQAIDSAFTLKEKEILAGTLIQIKGAGSTAAGWYLSGRYAGRGGNVSIITIDPAYATDERASVTVHEATHALRDLDPNRLPELKRQGRIETGRDSDLEESLTEAETVGREKPLTTQNFADKGGGYYPHLSTSAKAGRGNQSVVIDDRRIITKPKEQEMWLNSGRKGKRVQRRLKEDFQNTSISKLKIKGGVEAIDSFYGLKNKGGETIKLQVYSPNAHTPPIIEKGDLQTVEYKDGKAVVISGKQRTLNSKTPRISRGGMRITPRTPRIR